MRALWLLLLLLPLQDFFREMINHTKCSSWSGASASAFFLSFICKVKANIAHEKMGISCSIASTCELHLLLVKIYRPSSSSSGKQASSRMENANTCIFLWRI